MGDQLSDIGVVVIGRNEGENLNRCLRSVIDNVAKVIYVDSGSDDGSQELAAELGVDVINLDISIPFTAARARNAGFQKLVESYPQIKYVQFVDGDCEVVNGWLEQAHGFLSSHDKFAVVCGRRREIRPENSIYNRLCDFEWDTPVGEAEECGGDALMRVSAIKDVDGYRNSLIAGEEPEMCVRLRKLGWKVQRIDAEMTLHDLNMLRFGQWWRRSLRAGHAYAEVFSLHPEFTRQVKGAAVRRSLLWGGILPVMIILGSFFSKYVLFLLAIYPLQVLRLAYKKGISSEMSWLQATFLTLSKFPEFQGILRYHTKKLFGQKSEIIEYK